MLPDDELRAEVDGELNGAASRDELLDYLAEQADSDVEIEVVYPGRRSDRKRLLVSW